MKKKLLAVAMGAMLAAGAANAVTVGHGGLGDLLIAPWWPWLKGFLNWKPWAPAGMLVHGRCTHAISLLKPLPSPYTEWGL